MKKIILSLIFITVVFSGHAQYYYDAYPITVTQTTNGTQYRLELSCYDSSLSSITTFNTAYYDTNYFDIDIGLVAYTGISGSVGGLGICQVGAVTYDHEVHQWTEHKQLISTYPHSVGSTAWSGTFQLHFDPSVFSGSDAEMHYGRYNIIKRKFDIINSNNHDDDYFGVQVNGLYATTNCGYQPADENELYFNNYHTGTFQPAVGFNSGFAGFGHGEFNETTAVSSSDVTQGGGIWDVDISAFDPSSCFNCKLYYLNADYHVNKSNYIIENNDSYQIYYAKYDAAFHKWMIDSFPEGSIDSWVMGQNVLAFKNTGGNMVISAVYDFNKHRWEVDNTPSTQVDSLKITDGTVSWFDGSVYQQRGYNPLIGWNGNSTVLTPIFYAPDLSQPNGGNIIFIRDYSIGVKPQGWYQNPSCYINFGDGSTSNTSNDWHLYKKNGSYLYQGAPLTDTICYTVYSTADSATTCVPINCFSPPPTISSSLQYLCVGDTALLTATSGGLSYQWLYNGNIIAGATNNTYSTTIGGKYQCMVSDVCGLKYSNQLNVQRLYPLSGLTISNLNQGSICSATNNFQLKVDQHFPQTNYSWMRDSVLIQTTTSNVSGVISPVAGNYYCIISNSCITDTSNVLNVTVGQTPTAYVSLIGSNTFCVGDSALLTAVPFTGCSYQWRKNGVDIVGATDTLYYALSSGNYSCTLTDIISGCTANSNSVIINALTTPSVTLISNKNDTLCSTPSTYVTLSVGPFINGNTYTWRKNGIQVTSSNNSSFSFNASAGIYDCIVTNICGVDTSNSFTITIIYPPQPVVSGSSHFLCANSSMLLNVVPSGGYYYQWKKAGNSINGATLNNYLITTAGNYSCVLTDSVCSASSPTYNVATAGNPTSFIIPLGPTSFCSPDSVILQSNIAATVTYQWLKNGIPLPGATARNFVASSNGSYRVTNTNTSGCDSTSNPVIVNVPCAYDVGGGNGYLPTNRILEAGLYNVFPNPVVHKLFIESNQNSSGILQLKIIDILGKEVLRTSLINREGFNSYSLDVSTLSAGVYFVELNNNLNKSIFKVVKD